MEIVFVYSSNVYSFSWLYMVWVAEFSIITPHTIHDRDDNKIAVLGCLIFFMSIGEGVPVRGNPSDKIHICNIGYYPGRPISHRVFPLLGDDSIIIYERW